MYELHAAGLAEIEMEKKFVLPVQYKMYDSETSRKDSTFKEVSFEVQNMQ